jgi:C1A family cysteine protease
MNIKIKKYGWQHDLPDKRDFLFSQFVKVGVLPSKVDFLEIKNDMTFINLSRLFVYYNERVVENTVDFDSGATLRGGIKTLKKLGVCNEKICPYIISKFTQKPDKQAYQDGKNHQIQIYMRLTAINQMKQCLADGFPFVFGFSVYESFESGSVKKTGTVNLPKPDERVIGGHAVMAVEYDNKIKRFIVRNSWGIKWGMKGYFTMPYEYLADRNLSDDFWTIRKGENV